MLSARIALVGGERTRGPEFCRRVLALLFVEHRETAAKPWDPRCD